MPIGDARDTALNNKKNRELAQLTASYRAAARPVVRKKKDDPITGFIKRATKVVGNVQLPSIGASVPSVRPRNQFGGRVATQKTVGPKVKHVVEAAGEASGVNSARRIRAGKGTWGDYLTVAAIALPPTLRAGATAARQPAFRISPQMTKRIVGEGGAVIRSNPKLKGPKEIAEMVRGSGGLPRVKRFPSRHEGIALQADDKIREANPWLFRTPFLSERHPRGRVIIGGPGDEHADVLRTLPPFRNMNDEQIHEVMYGNNYELSEWDWIQGHINKPVPDAMKLELGFGDDYGVSAPKNLAQQHRLVNYLLRNYDDSDISLGQLFSPLRPPRKADHTRLGGGMTKAELDLIQDIINKTNFTHRGR